MDGGMDGRSRGPRGSRDRGRNSGRELKRAGDSRRRGRAESSKGFPEALGGPTGRECVCSLNCGPGAAGQAEEWLERRRRTVWRAPHPCLPPQGCAPPRAELRAVTLQSRIECV